MTWGEKGKELTVWPWQECFIIYLFFPVFSDLRLLLFLYAIGQSDTDSSDSALTQESHQVGRTEPGAIVTPHLLLAVCGLLDNLLAVLPEFSLSSLKQNQILENMARLERRVKTNRCCAKFCHYLYFLKHHTDILLVNYWMFIKIF